MKQTHNDFIKGRISLKFVAHYKSGYYIVTKGDKERKFTIKEYFDIQLQNYETQIDFMVTKQQKLYTTNFAIFQTQIEYLNNSNEEILNVIRKNVEHLKAIREYIQQSLS